MRGRLQGAGHRIAGALLVGLLALGGLPVGEAGQNGPEALVDGFVRAWNSHDMKAFADLFTVDADFVNVAGMWWKGRAEIQAKHEESHATRFKTTNLVSTGTSVRLLRGDIAVIHFSWELTGQLDGEGNLVPPPWNHSNACGQAAGRLENNRGPEHQCSTGQVGGVRRSSSS
jgi:uncharacterized protein (TIGR02246 family)